MKMLNIFILGFKKYKYFWLFLVVLNFIIWLNCLPAKLLSDPTCTVLYGKSNTLLGARIAGDGQWRFPAGDSLPYKFEKAILLFEDEGFYRHSGFSLKGFCRAIYQNISNGRVVSGGSTITMQLCRLARKGRSRNLWEKIIEFYQATRLEFRWNKDEILLQYAANAPMGGNVVGVWAASWRYFGRDASTLSWAEAATLAVLPNAPGLMHPGKRRRLLKAKRDRLLDKLYSAELLEEMEWKLAKLEPLPDKPRPIPQLAPHLLDKLSLGANRGKIHHSEIAADLQVKTSRLISEKVSELGQKEIHNACALIVDIKNGAIIAYVGNSVPGSKSEHSEAVDIVSAPRSTGSILKPLLYAKAVDDGIICPKEQLMDIPTIMYGYAPKNYDGRYDGIVGANEAVSRSLNVPMVNLLRKFGVANFRQDLNEMGFGTITRTADDYGLSLILGGAEVCLFDLSMVYASMAHALNSYNSNVNSSFKVSSLGTYWRKSYRFPTGNGAIWLTFNTMLDVVRPSDEANWRQFEHSRKIAWKTGTSYGFRDAWAIGVTPEYLVGVWVGNADGEGRPGIVGGEAAAPIMFDLFGLLPKSGWFVAPYDEMQEVKICRQSGKRASMDCPEGHLSYLPHDKINSGVCNYHQHLMVSLDEKFRLNRACVDEIEAKLKPYFVLPPVVEKFYVTKHPEHVVLPPYDPSCAIEQPSGLMDLIYPKILNKISLPKTVNGELTKVVFRAVHSDPEALIFWHLGDTFYGSTAGIHEMELQPEPGSYILKLVDHNGVSFSRKVTILDRKKE